VEHRGLRKIYCIPGFGADTRIFRNLTLHNAELVGIEWPDPLSGETYSAYVQRMAAHIKEEEPVIIGVSFGGMVALEIARTRRVKQVILISSIKTTEELPLIWRWAGRLRLNRVLPLNRLRESEVLYKLANKRLGAFAPQEQQLANHYRRHMRINYVKWALEQVLHWKNEYVPENIIHIHGSDDQIFPVKTSHPTHIIEGGTHMIVLNRAAEVSTIINDALQKLH
jgi:hypothetical protein